MKTQEQIQKDTDAIMALVDAYKAEGRQYATFRWLKEHQLLGNVQNESKHKLSSITRTFIESNVNHLTDYHIV